MGTKRDGFDAMVDRWVEVRVVTDRFTPHARERVLLYVDGEPRPPARMTDARGVVRWDALSRTARRFGVQLVDVLESWRGPATLGRAPKPDRFRREDDMVHDVNANVPAAEQPITVTHLDEAQKLAYFRQAYTDNAAVYGAAAPHAFGLDPPRWRWGRGALCNEHVNFFLAFWFNYNERFTAGGSSTCMAALPTFSSARQRIWNGYHRGYREFLAPITGGGIHYRHPGLRRIIEYHFIHPHFDAEDGAPTSDLASRLGDVNVYSISDEALHVKVGKQRRRDGSLAVIRAWIHAHPERAPRGLPASALSEDDLWSVAWRAQRSDPGGDALQRRLFDYVIFDHHAGILYRKDDGRLYTFSADSNGPIQEKPFLDTLHRKKNLWMALWRLDRLRPGGYAPLTAERNEGRISIDNPPRFIQWVDAGSRSAAKTSRRPARRTGR